MQWIKATERLPKSGDEVFIKIEGTRSIGAYKKHHDLFMSVSGDFFPADQVEWLDEADDWIPVKKENPVPGEFVLIIIETDTILKGRLMNNGWAAMFLDGEHLVGPDRDVTHWRPLPPLPSTPQGGDKK